MVTAPTMRLLVASGPERMHASGAMNLSPSTSVSGPIEPRKPFVMCCMGRPSRSQRIAIRSTSLRKHARFSVVTVPPPTADSMRPTSLSVNPSVSPPNSESAVGMSLPTGLTVPNSHSAMLGVVQPSACASRGVEMHGPVVAPRMTSLPIAYPSSCMTSVLAALVGIAPVGCLRSNPPVAIHARTSVVSASYSAPLPHAVSLIRLVVVAAASRSPPTESSMATPNMPVISATSNAPRLPTLATINAARPSSWASSSLDARASPPSSAALMSPRSMKTGPSA